MHLGEVPLRQVLDATDKEETFWLDGKEYPNVRMRSLRLSCFRRSLSCAACGLEGTQCLLDLQPGAKKPHVNLYATENEELVLMTKDHIVPVSRGGSDDPSNLRTMCAPCNHVRGNNQTLTLDDIRAARVPPKKAAT